MLGRRGLESGAKYSRQVRLGKPQRRLRGVAGLGLEEGAVSGRQLGGRHPESEGSGGEPSGRLAEGGEEKLVKLVIHQLRRHCNESLLTSFLSNIHTTSAFKIQIKVRNFMPFTKCITNENIHILTTKFESFDKF